MYTLIETLRNKTEKRSISPAFLADVLKGIADMVNGHENDISDIIDRLQLFSKCESNFVMGNCVFLSGSVSDEFVSLTNASLNGNGDVIVTDVGEDTLRV